MPQLYDVSKILSTKLEPLGFGTFLAEQTIRVCRVYEQMDTNIPNGFLDRFSLDAAVDMLCSISRAVRESDVMVRIVGISGAGYIISYVLTLFPNDCLIMVEGVIINSSERQKIIIEISATADLAGPTQIFVEEILPHKVAVALPIETTHLRNDWRFGNFQWQRYIGDQLDLTFINMGLPGCSSEILVASCDLVFALPCWTEDIFSSYGDPFPEGGLVALLGSEPWYRIQKVLTEVLGTSPNLPRKSLTVAWSAFLDVVGKAISVVSCTCNRCTPEGFMGKAFSHKSAMICPVRILWNEIKCALDEAISAIFIIPGENVSFQRGVFYLPIIQDVIRNFFADENRIYFGYLRLYSAYVSASLAICRGSCVCYPTELATLQKFSDFQISFTFLDGMLVFNGRYFRSLVSSAPVDRMRAKKSIVYKAKRVVPSNIGEHSRLTLSIREKLLTLELGAMVHGPDRLVRVNLVSILQASIGLRRTQPCEHSVDGPLLPEHISKVLITSVFEPRPVGKRTAIVQVKSNPEAQLLSCEPGPRLIFQSECCLTCAVERIEGGEQTIIIAS